MKSLSKLEINLEDNDLDIKLVENFKWSLKSEHNRYLVLNIIDTYYRENYE